MLNIIKASAGSGKTFTLALEYITLLLGEKSGNGFRLYSGKKREYHRHILAVTFTNKATEEMKQRIVNELAVLAGIRKGNNDYMVTLRKRFAATESEVRDAAKRVLTELLFDYANFNVSTIDSFFQVILRTFAAEVEIPYDYDIELNDDFALAVGVHDFLNLIRSNDKDYSRVILWLNNYVTEQLQAGESNWNPFKEGNMHSSDSSYRFGNKGLFSLAGVINKEIFRKVHSEMDNYLGVNSKSLTLFQNEIVKKTERLLDSIRESVKTCNRRFINDGYEDCRSKRGSLSAWLYNSKSPDFVPTIKDIAYLAKYVNDTPNNVTKTLLKKCGMEPPSEDFNIFINQQCGNALEYCKQFVLYKNIASNIYKLGLLGYISRCVNNFRKENNLILLSDTNALLNDIIGEDDTPFIYERIGTQINNFLIDEFQDTSELQWHNMEPMLRNSLASDYFNLIIGDEKQCIYRFRNSDPSLLQYRVGNDLRSWIAPGDTKNRNWRSAPMVVKFNNTFFWHLAKELGLGSMYGNVVQLYKPGMPADKGYVRINTLSKVDAESVSDKVISLICDIIDRGYKQSDIAILVDRNTEGATIIRKILEYNKKPDRRREINVVSNESLLLCNSPAVRLVVSYLRYMALSISIPDDNDTITGKKAFNEKLHRVLRQYERLLNNGFTPGDALDYCFANTDEIGSVKSEISDFMPSASESYSLVSVVERIIERVSPAAHDKENVFLQAFQDVVIDFSNRTCGTILSFLRWWDHSGSKLSIASPEGIDAVNVMTIHKSKGLEFACVILPCATWSIGKLDSTLWFTHDEVADSKLFGDNFDNNLIPPLLPVNAGDDLKDSALSEPFNRQLNQTISDCLNKTYVAFTRAVDELHIFTKFAAATGENKTTKGLEYYLKHICDKATKEAAEKLNLEFYNSEENATTESSDERNTVTDVATWVNRTDIDCNEYYFETPSEVAEKRTVEKDALESIATQDSKDTSGYNLNKGHLMEPYKVVNRHDLAKFKLPDVLYTPERERGILYHKILSMICSERDVERVLRYCEVRYVLPTEKEEREKIKRDIREMISQNAVVKEWFAAGNHVYNERPIIDGKNRPRPDRVITTPSGETVIIDYKFGEEHNKSYAKQLKSYMNLLIAAGFSNIKGYIWYPFTHQIVTVT